MRVDGNDEHEAAVDHFLRKVRRANTEVPPRLRTINRNRALLCTNAANASTCRNMRVARRDANVDYCGNARCFRRPGPVGRAFVGAGARSGEGYANRGEHQRRDRHSALRHCFRVQCLSASPSCNKLARVSMRTSRPALTGTIIASVTMNWVRFTNVPGGLPNAWPLHGSNFNTSRTTT
jgi:hypothetical protein